MDTTLNFHGWMMLLASFPASALPNLHESETIGDIKIFRDNLDENVFYYQKGKKELALNNGVPEFSFHINRYFGTRITDDQEEYRVRGAIMFKTTETFGEYDYQEIKEILESKYSKKIHLKPCPVANSYNKLIYSTVTEPSQSDGSVGEIDHVHSRDHSEENKFLGTDDQHHVIGLSGNDANFFWDNFEKNNLVLSLSYGWVIPAVSKNEAGEWIQRHFELANVTPITVSKKDFPNLFKKNELWQRVDVAHSSVMIMCYDFLNPELAGLYKVTVDFRFKTIRNQMYEHRIEFNAKDLELEKIVNFQLVNSLRDGYEYKVIRTNLDGEKHVSEWIKTREAAVDITLAAGENTTELLKGGVEYAE